MLLKKKINRSLLQKTINTLLCIVVILGTRTVSAQQELFTYCLDSLPYGQHLNPAKSLHKNIDISILSFYNSFDIKGPSLRDLNSSYDKTKIVIDPSRIAASLLDKNVLNFNSYIQTLSVGFKVKGLTFDIGHAFRQQSYLVYPNELVILFANGNKDYIGSPMNLGIQTNLTSFHEFNLGLSGRLGKLRLGTNFKFLIGVANLSTSNDHLTLTTSDDIYQLDLEADFVLNNTGLITIDDTNHVVSNLGELSKFGIEEKNFGFAMDFGLKYDINDKFSVSGSLLDVGFISWTAGTQNYSLQRSIKFDGLVLEDLIGGDTLAIQDTLDSFIRFDKTSNGYKTNLSSSLYLSVSYQPIQILKFTGLYYRQMNKHFDSYAIALSGFVALTDNTGVGVIYSIRDNEFNNLGLSTTFRVGPVNVFAMTDNIFSIIKPSNAKHLNFRIGSSVTF